MSVNRRWPIVFAVTRLMLKVTKEWSRNNPDEGGSVWGTGDGCVGLCSLRKEICFGGGR